MKTETTVTDLFETTLSKALDRAIATQDDETFAAMMRAASAYRKGDTETAQRIYNAWK